MFWWGCSTWSSRPSCTACRRRPKTPADTDRGPESVAEEFRMRLPLLALHITGGMIGLLSGALAMVYRKGSRGHRVSGNVFVVSMLIMGACGSTLAFMKHEIGNV